MFEQGQRWIGRGGWFFMAVGWVMMIAGYVTRDGDLGAPLFMAAAGLFLVAIFAFIIRTGIEYKSRKRADAGSFRDAEQRKWTATLIMMGLCALPMSVLSSLHLWDLAHGIGESRLSGMVLGPLMSLLLFIIVVTGLRKGKHAQKWLNDELMRTYWVSAMAWGFVAAFVGLCAVFGLMLWRMPLVLPLMPFVLWAVVSVASWRLWWQVREAERG